MTGRKALVFGAPPVWLPVLRDRIQEVGYAVEAIDGAALGSSADVEESLTAALNPEAHLLLLGPELFPIPAEDAIRVGIRRSFVAMRLVLRNMMRQRFGRIITVAPSLDIELPHQALREGLAGLVKSVGREVGTRGITANLVAPGHMEGEGRTVPTYNSIGRLATIEDVAGVVGFCAGSQSDYVTGQVLMVDGGLDTT